jgi:hypothetical protein
MSFSNDITEQYLDKLYEDMSKEQSRILTDLKTGCDNIKENDNQKQFNLINTLMMSALKLRNLKKKIKQRIDN